MRLKWSWFNGTCIAGAVVGTTAMGVLWFMGYAVAAAFGLFGLLIGVLNIRVNEEGEFVQRQRQSEAGNDTKTKEIIASPTEAELFNAGQAGLPIWNGKSTAAYYKYPK